MNVPPNPARFETLYQANPDPWNFQHSEYEREKYAATMTMLEKRRYHNAFEIGCSIGVLTGMLAPQCDHLLAVDVSDTALNAAIGRCAGFGHVTFENRLMPDQWPAQQAFDLILISEVLYFLDHGAICRLAELANAGLAPGGRILLVNYTEKIEEPASGDQVADLFIARMSGTLTWTHDRREKFRMDMLEKRDSLR